MFWKMRYSWLFWLFYQVSHRTVFVYADNCGKEMDFKVTMEGKTLVNHVFKTERATNDAHCEGKCFSDDRCISYSFGTSASGEEYMCELSDSDHIMHPDDLVDRPGVIYRSAQNTCDCIKNSICRFNFADGTHRCECKLGFTGSTCNTDINECASNPCQNGGSCQDEVNSYTCTCTAGFTGTNCQADINECGSNPCQNGGSCHDQDNSFNCTCEPGYEGKNCEIKVIKVKSNVCVGTKYDRYGSFTIPDNYRILTFKLVYVSGGVSFAGNARGNWGGTYFSNKDIHLHITDALKNKISPPSTYELSDTRYGLLAYQIPGVTNTDPELTFPNLPTPLAATAGKEFRIWFGQDLNDESEGDNHGQTCADVWIKVLTN